MTTESEQRSLFGANTEAINQYVDILINRGISWGLLGPREADGVWERHIANSVAARTLIPQDSTVVDVGSGAGLPGIPLALCRPDLEVVLLESLLRRVTFLEGVLDELALQPRVDVVRARAEDHHGRYDTVISRAVAPLPKLIGWCAPLRSDDGQILAIKGASAEREVDDASDVLEQRGLVAEVLELSEGLGSTPATVIRIR